MVALDFGPQAGRITGRMDTRQVWVDEVPLSLSDSYAHVKHSPDGFNWGYSGSGPAQLAFAILLTMFGAEVAQAHYQEFKSQFIANLPQTNFSMDINQVNEWMQAVTSRMKGDRVHVD